MNKPISIYHFSVFFWPQISPPEATTAPQAKSLQIITLPPESPTGNWLPIPLYRPKFGVRDPKADVQTGDTWCGGYLGWAGNAGDR